jgi:phage baseplate assembly protein W
MAKRLKNLEKISKKLELDDYLYQDLKLDFEKATDFSKITSQKIEKNDIKVSYDESAVRNSLRNLFNTRPGQRFLFPKYGLDLHTFLFEPLNEENARTIGEVIVRTVTIFEPRVKVELCRVTPIFEENMYDIILIVSLPTFNTRFSLNTNLDLKSQSLTFIENSKNS